jgi:hypothetical protein
MNFLLFWQELLFSVLESDFVKSHTPSDFLLMLFLAMFIIMMATKIVLAHYFDKKQKKWLSQKYPEKIKL